MPLSLNQYDQQDLKTLLGLLLFTTFIHTAGLFQFTNLAIQDGFFPGPTNWTTAIVVNSLLVLAEIGLLLLYRRIDFSKIFQMTARVVAFLSHLSWANLLISLAAIAGFTYLALSQTGHFIPVPFSRLFLFWVTVLSVALLLKAWSLRTKKLWHLRYFHWLVISLLLSAFGFLVFSYYPDISRYPYTLTWSETSRYYYASLFFSERIYGVRTPPTVLHPSRYLLQAIPFLLPKSSLILHRAWQVLLWVVITGITACLIIRRSGTEPRNSILGAMASMWAFIYLLVGPVYYHLQIPLILVLWGFNRNRSPNATIRFVYNLIIIAIASAWAGISRINWFPVPGLLAATLLFIEHPLKKTAPIARAGPHESRLLTRASVIYGAKAVAWTMFGTVVAFITQNLYILWSGNSSKEFVSSFSSDLLWYRLLPSSTYPLGVLPGAILISLPLWILVWSKLNFRTNNISMRKQVHPIRLLGLFVILLVLLAGGLVVSVKIGGGSNLHNLDAYLALLLIITIMIIFDQLKPDFATAGSPVPLASDALHSASPGFSGDLSTPLFKGRLQITGLVLSLMIPISLILLSKGPVSAYPSLDEINRGLSVTTRAIENLNTENPNVLFLTNRHWLTFGYIKGVPLIPEYERVFLMEMAMADNREYLNNFRRDLANQRFDLIISEPIYTIEKNQQSRFSEENNAWVNQVSKYILCYYKPKAHIKPVSVQILIPRDKKGDCE